MVVIPWDVGSVHVYEGLFFCSCWGTTAMLMLPHVFRLALLAGRQFKAEAAQISGCSQWRSSWTKKRSSFIYPSTRPSTDSFIHSFSHCFIDAVIHWFICSMIQWFIGSLISLVHWFIDSLVHWFTDSLMLIDSLIPGLLTEWSWLWLVHRFVDSLAHWFIDWLIHWLIDWLAHCFFHSLIGCFTDSLIHWSLFCWRRL